MMPARVKDTLKRFWSYTKPGPNECLEWHGGRHADGYGQVYWGGKTRRASRVIWEVLNGPIPEGLYVCHSCNNKPCVNPKHLYLGTPTQNTLDAIRDGLRTPTKVRNETCPKCGGEYKYSRRGERQCRTCRNTRHLAFMANQRKEQKALKEAIQRIESDPTLRTALTRIADSPEGSVVRNALLAVVPSLERPPL